MKYSPTIWIRKIKNTGTNIWRVYLQLGAPIPLRDMKCRFHTASMKHHDIKLTLARRDQSTNSSAPCKEIFQLIGPCFHETRQDRNWWRDQMLSAREVNLHESSRRISNCLATWTWKSKISPGKQKKHTWHPFTRNYKETTKPTQFMWRVRNLHEQNLATMEEFDWHDILNNRRNDKENTGSCDQSDYQTWWVTTWSTHFTISKAQAARE